jgi:hypothetical protein
MDDTLKKAKHIHKDGCVSIIMNSHRTSPENRQDGIRLKNMLNEAEKRLNSQLDKKLAGKIVERLKNLAESIDHSKNLDSLVLFANADHSSYTTLPIKVDDRVIVDRTFATRDLIRAMRRESSYFILVLSKNEARLLMGLHDNLIHEYQGVFPMKNEIFTTDPLKISMSKGQDQLIEEFFNRVDKEAEALMGNSRAPVVLVTEKRNAEHFMKMADHKDRFTLHLTGNYSKAGGNELAKLVWPLVKQHNIQQEQDKIVALKEAVSAGNVLSDLDEIWQAIQSRKGYLLFVEKDYFQPAIMEGRSIIPVNELDESSKGIDDVVDEMIESILEKGGDAVFVEKGLLKDFNEVALVTRVSDHN